MAFGFDPSIILSARETDPLELPRTLAQLATSATQRQAAQATLADMVRKQQQQATLADIYRANAETPEALPSALLRAGLGQEAFAAQDQASQLQTQRAQQAKLLREIQEAQRKQVGELFYGVTDQDSWSAARAQLPDYYQAHVPEQFDPAVAKRLSNMAIPAEKRSERDFSAEQKQLDRVAAEKRASIVAGGLAGKQLTPTALGELADYDTAQQQVDDLFAKAERENISGLGAKLNQAVTDKLGLQSTDAAKFEGASAPVRQGVGTILEGGKLAAGDEVKYKNMLPKYGDSKEVLAEKKKSLKAYLETRKAERAKTLKAGGYNVPGALSTGPHGPTVTQGGHTYTWNPKTGAYE